MTDINKLVQDFENQLVELCNSFAMPYCIKRISLEKVVLILKQAETEAIMKAEKDGDK